MSPPSVPVRIQGTALWSGGLTSHSTVARPSSAAMTGTRSSNTPFGGRKQCGVTPVAASITAVVRLI